MTEDTEWLSPAQVCSLLPGMTEEILSERRKQRLDPPYFKPTGERGKVVLYDRAEVIAWVLASRVATRPGSDRNRRGSPQTVRRTPR